MSISSSMTTLEVVARELNRAVLGCANYLQSGHVSPACQEWLAPIDMFGTVCFRRATQQPILSLVATAVAMGRYDTPPLTNREAWGCTSRSWGTPQSSWGQRSRLGSKPSGADLPHLKS